MRPDDEWLAKDPGFWAYVRAVSEKVGYSTRKTKLKPSSVDVPSVDRIIQSLDDLGLDGSEAKSSGNADDLHRYFKYRADILNDHVEQQLMDADAARLLFEAERLRIDPPSTVKLPMNKQSDEKATKNYLSGLVNMLMWEALEGSSFDDDPRALIKITRNGRPLRTLTRRQDGAFPSVHNPIAIWELKEYYHTTSFGSRVSGGVYESQLDGLELQELEQSEGIKVRHYLIVDSHFTWWGMGKSYLCRMVDMVNMGLADEVLFGREVVTEIPRIASELLAIQGIETLDKPL